MIGAMLGDTEVSLDERLPFGNVAGCTWGGWFDDGSSHDISKTFLGHGLYVIDGIDWGGALEVIQQHGLDPRRREFKAPFIERKPSPEVSEAVGKIVRQAKELYPRLYPWPATIAHSSFRPMITGPEPLHYDSYGGKHPLVTAYINVSTTPRIYRIGWSFDQLVAARRDEVAAAFAERRKPEDDASYPIRMRTQRGKGPLGPDAPRHEVRLAPGAIWFFNAKTVAHEVVYGEGAIGIGWEVPTSGAKLQRDILKEAGLL